MRYVSEVEIHDENVFIRIIRSWIFWVIICVIVASVSIFGYRKFQASKPMISSQETEKVAFPVYTPRKLDSGYVIDTNKIRASGQSFAYDIRNKNNDSQITVTVQPVPSGFDMTKMTGNGTVSSTSTKNGALYNLSAGGKNQYLLNTGDALVFFTSQGEISTATINKLADELVKQN